MGESAPVEGLRLGRYEVLRHLASGGMADLLLARSSGLEGFQRHVVIKRIRADAAKEPKFVKMFLDEARLAASLHHHNIVQVHDVGQENGDYYFAMEYVHGEDLRRFLLHLAKQKIKTPLEHVVAIVSAACAGLHHAHEQRGPDRKPLGLVHRDVSPANILVGHDGNVKVVDFGIAKAVAKTSETRTGVLKGKVAYMSPEQCLGEALDRRSDVYALGIVLYEATTVRRLFKGDNDYLTMSAIVEGKIPPPTELRPDTPPELTAIIVKALAKERAERYQTADELRVALEAFAANANLRPSANGLAAYMSAQFGNKPNPWEDEHTDLGSPISPDFDGSQDGVVSLSTKVLEDLAVPAKLDDLSSAPIARARKKALSQAPPISDAESSAQTPMAWTHETNEPPMTRVRTSHLAGAAVVLIALTALVVFLVVRPDSSPDATAAAPRPEIVTVPVVVPPQVIQTPAPPDPPAPTPMAATPDAAVPEAPVEAKKPAIKPKPPQTPGTKKWNPNKLFPK